MAYCYKFFTSKLTWRQPIFFTALAQLEIVALADPQTPAGNSDLNFAQNLFTKQLKEPELEVYGADSPP